MSTCWSTIINSSYGDGIFLSIENGKRQESFLNTTENWFLAQEFSLGDSYFEWELKTPGLGDLQIWIKEWGDKEFEMCVARFPKGTWEFAKLIMEK